MTRVVLIGASLLLAWLLAGRQITAFVDRVIPMPVASLAVSPLGYDGGGFVIGDIPMLFASMDNQRLNIDLTFDSANRAILSWRNESFILGPRTSPPDLSGRPRFDFVAESGDEITFTRRRSLVSWPTPFEIKIMGGQPPWWKRYIYYRLIWKKPTGATLEMRWRYEQQYLSARGWTKPAMMWNSQTALLSVEIHPESEGSDGAVVRHIARTKGWRRGEYRIEPRGQGVDGRSGIFAVIHADDARCATPGAGKSVVLYVDPFSLQITKELGGQ